MKKPFPFRRFSALFLILCVCVFQLPAAAEEPDLSRWLVDDSIDEHSRVEDVLSRMTLHEKVCQLFFVQPESFSRVGVVIAFSKGLENAIQRFPVGGVILFSRNISREDLADLNAGMQQAALDVNGIGLFIGVDEEGGLVSRVANRLKLPEKQSAPGWMVSVDEAYLSALIIGGYLTEYGFNLDFAPVADVRADVEDAEITTRSYGSDPETVSRMVVRFTEGLREKGIISVLKHFPGQGSASGNTHFGFAVSQRTREELDNTDLVPFSVGIYAGVGMVMVSHQVTPALDQDTPASMSPKVISVLRDELGFGGVIITDALRMGAIHDTYGSREACILALEAGADMILLPSNFTVAYKGVMQAVSEGRITEKRIDESVRRILTLKEKYGLLPSVGQKNN